MKGRLTSNGGIALVTFLSVVVSVDAFPSFTPVPRPSHGLLSRRFSVSNKSQQTEVTAASTTSTTALEKDSSSTTKDQVSKWREKAERMRREAAQMDSALTSEKIAALERKLANQSWLETNPEQVDTLQQQLTSLQDKQAGKKPAVSNAIPSSESANESDEIVASSGVKEQTEMRKDPTVSASSNKPLSDSNKLAQEGYWEDNPLCGYDQADLDLYIPVVKAIEVELPSNATLDEKLAAFRASPELQPHFQEKIRKMIVEPMEDMQRLESLKQEYLQSSSSVERMNIKREIDQLEKTVEDESPFFYSDSIVMENLPRLEEEDIQKRMEAVGALHPILQALYKKRCGVNEKGDLRLAIEMDHFEPQLQLLEQVHSLDPITDEVRHEIRVAILSLPMSVRDNFAKSQGLKSGEDVTAMITALVDGEGEQWMTLQQVMTSTTGDSDGSSISSLDLPEYNDLDFMDRSRYVQEFLPALTRLEIIHPPLEDIDKLMKEVLDKKAFMVTSKPERVIGGYFIRGRNVMSEPETESTDDMVAYLQERLQKSSVRDKIDLFWVQDPAPPTDEQYEVGDLDRPVLIATAKSRNELYNLGDPVMKTVVSLLGLFSLVVFSAATAEMQPFLRDQVEAAAAGDLSIDISPIFSSAFQVVTAMIAVQLAHELAHRVVAWRDKFDIGLPTLVPSINMGLMGGITPLRSPPPSKKSLFDFALAGPLAGFLVSLALLVGGLDITASTDMALANQLPAYPVAILRSSSLGGGLIEFFVGKGSLTSAPANAVLPLHPFAIAGFVGVLSNALALLPLGHTDGGRISLSMFGRRGAYLVTIFTTLGLCALGIFGLDEPRTFLSYSLFAIIWQRELEAPILNEADELDFTRGLAGIGSAIVVFLALMPMV